MRKQYWSLLLVGICGLYNPLRAQQPIDKQVNAAREQGLFRQTFTPFTKNTSAARPAAASLVDNATYLQMQQEQTLRIYNEHPAALTLSLPQQSGQELELELVQQSPFAPGFFVSTSSSNNQPVSYTPGVYYRGKVKGMEGSVVAVSVFKDEIIGVATTPDKGNLVLGRLQNSGQDDYILYSDLDLKQSSSFSCDAEMPLGYTEKIREYLSEAARPTADKCVRVYLECDYRTNQSKGGVTGATNYVTAIFNNLATLYANESITTAISQVFVWTTQDNYTASSTSSVLNTFRSTRTTFNGDIAHLVSVRSGGAMGGIAWVDALCSSYRYAYSQILASYSNVPTYSWSVECMTHEMGHNLGSPHTHNCAAWSGGAIDGCGAAAGYPEGSCSAPIPSSAVGGTIMSYCHLTSTGIKFSNGFGPQPGNLIRNRVAAASCLGSNCSTTPPAGCTDNAATLTIVLDNYPEETSWDIKNSAAQVVASGGTYGSSPDGSTITVPLCLPNGCYTLTMKDVYGDGMCCSYGNGSYTLRKNADNSVLASGGQFGTQDVKTFCFNAGLPSQGGLNNVSGLAANAGFNVYPNPARDVLHVRWSAVEAAAAQMMLTDIAGRKIAVYTTNGVAGKNSFDIMLQQLPAGMYLLQLETGGNRFQQKVMIQQR
ncbi:M12 family metallo-peptidase [Taibaiella koreensis]|uniref:M12 family metallo-peptidase n=1 Tax=Taibaiella koreensis TaxID=1268548 RepID=UPI000E599C7D|nr:M12 family metallo-peptidase [Taibaiella koreensis]